MTFTPAQAKAYAMERRAEVLYALKRAEERVSLLRNELAEVDVTISELERIINEGIDAD